jgi:hypothetical protein
MKLGHFKSQICMFKKAQYDMKYVENIPNSVTVLKLNVRFVTTDIFACRENCDLRNNGLISKGRAWLP